MTNTTMNEQSIKNICRACLKDNSEGVMKSVLNGNLYELFTKFTNLELSEDDNLPSKLCLLCIDRLNNSVSFRELCIKSDRLLKQQKAIGSDVNQECAGNTQAINITDASINHFLEVTYFEKSENVSHNRNQMEMENINDLHENVEKNHRKRINRIKRKPSAEKLHKNETTASENRETKLPDYNIYLSCPICGEDFFKIDRLEAHYRTHLGKKPEVCNICNKEFSKPYYLQAHMVSHKGKDPVCLQCGKTFATKFSLRVHEKIHTGVRSFVCHVCGKSFHTNTHLKAHVARKHCDEKPYACDQCPRAFKISSALKEHLLRHSGIKKYICSICGSATVTKGELDKHMAAAHSDEKPFVCKSCPKRYKSSGQLTIHNRLHTGERPYPCDLCPKTFKTGEVLKKHRMIHTGEKPHVCCVCGRAFTQQCALTTHMKIHK